MHKTQPNTRYEIAMLTGDRWGDNSLIRSEAFWGREKKTNGFDGAMDVP